jgi:hypothetical protein
MQVQKVEISRTALARKRRTEVKVIDTLGVAIPIAPTSFHSNQSMKWYEIASVEEGSLRYVRAGQVVGTFGACTGENLFFKAPRPIC